MTTRTRNRTGYPILAKENCAFVEVNSNRTDKTASITPGNVPHEKVRHFSEDNGIPYVRFEQMAPNAVAELTSLNRSSIVLVGYWLEGIVTRLAIEILLSGLDVYIVADEVQSREPEHAPLFYNRIRSYGGVITTFGQIELELEA